MIRSVYIQADPEARNSLPPYPVLIRTDSVAKRTRGFDKKNRHMGGLAAIQSYFLLAFFPFLTLPSRSSVNSAIYTVPALSCHPYRQHTYTFVGFVCDDTEGGDERRKRDKYIERLSLVGGRDDCEWFSRRHHFILSDVI